MIICIDRDGVFLNFKGATSELYRPMDTYMGKHLQEVLPEDTADLCMSHLQEAFDTGQVQHLDYSLTFSDGLRHYEARMVRSTDNEAIAIVRNVTKRKRMEAQLHRYQENLRSQMEARTADWSMAENRYRSIFRHSGSPSIMVEQDFTVSMVNPKFEELTGYPRDEIENSFIGQDYKIAFMNKNLIRQVGFDATGKYCYGALHKRRTKCVWCVSDQVFDGRTVRFEMKNPNDQRWSSSVNVPIRLSDGTLCCQAMIRDIDERKRMEQGFATAKPTCWKRTSACGPPSKTVNASATSSERARPCRRSMN